MKMMGSGHARHSGSAVLFTILLILTMILCVLPAFAREWTSEWGKLTATAEIDPKNTGEIVVKVKADSAAQKSKKNETLYLFALLPYEDESNLAARAPAAQAPLSGETVFRVKDDGGSLKYAKFIVALGENAGYTAIGSPVYVNNPDAATKNRTQREKRSSLKGLTVSAELLSAAEELGIAHAVIPVVLDDFITYDYTDYAKTVDGNAVFFDENRVAALDHETETLRSFGISVTFRFLLNGKALGSVMPSADLYAPGAESGASLFGICSASRAGYERARAVFEFFAERYASEGITDFILGYQVNEAREWNNMGAVSKNAAARMYAETFRIADTALRSVSAESRVYVPLSNLYPAITSFLSVFAKERDGGAWSVSIAPYASDPSSDTVWDDAGTEGDAPSYLTMANLPLLKELLSEKAYKYENKLRAVIIDDYAVPGSFGSADSEERQAASLAYAYYRAANSGFVDAFILHRLYDAPDEGADYGLLSADGKEKKAYSVYRHIDTQLGNAENDDLLAVIGKKSWSSVFKGCSPKNAASVKRFEASPAELSEKDKPETLIGFADNLIGGFLPTESASAVLTTPLTGEEGFCLQVNAFSSATGDAPGTVLTLGNGFSLPNGTRYLLVTLRAQPADESITPAFTLRLGKTDGEDRYLFSGKTELRPGDWTTVAFDVSDYLRSADGADYLQLSAELGVLGGSFLIKEIAEVGGAKANPLKWFLVFLGILLFLVLVFAILVIRAKIIRAKKRKQRQRALAARRAAAARAQTTAPGTVRRDPGNERRK